MARHAEHGEVHRQHITLLATWEIRGRGVDGGHLAIRKRRRVKTRGLFRVFVVPKADRVLRCHARQSISDNTRA